MKKYGLLTAVKNLGVLNGRTTYLCKCDCGKTTKVTLHNLKTGNTKSCGCLVKKRGGNSQEPLCRIWYGMLYRCKSTKHNRAESYNKKGIVVCTAWHKYEQFKIWADQNGYKNGLQIDRIDNNKGYEPDNCRWVTPRKQQNNRTNNRRVTIDNQTKTLAEWADVFSVKYSTFWSSAKRAGLL